MKAKAPPPLHFSKAKVGFLLHFSKIHAFSVPKEPSLPCHFSILFKPFLYSFSLGSLPCFHNLADINPIWFGVITAREDLRTRLRVLHRLYQCLCQRIFCYLARCHQHKNRQHNEEANHILYNDVCYTLHVYAIFFMLIMYAAQRYAIISVSQKPLALKQH